MIINHIQVIIVMFLLYTCMYIEISESPFSPQTLSVKKLINTNIF